MPKNTAITAHSLHIPLRKSAARKVIESGNHRGTEQRTVLQSVGTLMTPRPGETTTTSASILYVFFLSIP